MNLILFPTPRS